MLHNIPDKRGFHQLQNLLDLRLKKGGDLIGLDSVEISIFHFLSLETNEFDLGLPFLVSEHNIARDNDL